MRIFNGLQGAYDFVVNRVVFTPEATSIGQDINSVVSTTLQSINEACSSKEWGTKWYTRIVNQLPTHSRVFQLLIPVTLFGTSLVVAFVCASKGVQEIASGKYVRGTAHIALALATGYLGVHECYVMGNTPPEIVTDLLG